MKMWEILVPCNFEDNKKPVSTRHHQNFDKFVLGVAGGITILKPCKGYWINEDSKYEDRVIPVRIACSEANIAKIAKFALSHYRQLAILYYEISNNVKFVRK